MRQSSIPHDVLTFPQVSFGNQDLKYLWNAGCVRPVGEHRQKIGTRSVHVGSRKKDQLTKLVICEITLNALFFPFMFSPPTNLSFREF